MTTVADRASLITRLLTRDGQQDPGPVFGELHALGEVHRSPFIGRLVTSYRAADALMRNPHVGKSRPDGRRGLPDEDVHASRRLLNATMLIADPPDHTRLRRLVNKAFTPRAVGDLRATIEGLIAARLDEITERAAAGEDVDLMDTLAFPLPVTVIGRLVGMPDADLPPFRTLIGDLSTVLDAITDDAELAAADSAADTMLDYFAGLVRERRAHPRDDLTTALIEARDTGDRLTEHELLTMLSLLFLAGFETTTHLIGNGILALLRHPDQLAKLRADPDLMPSAVEELLRYDLPTQTVSRITHARVTLPDGTVIPKNRFLLISLGAAHWDPRVFTHPERLDILRDEAPTLSFGSGIHYCLGAGLARLEARLVFGELLRRFPEITLAAEPERRINNAIRGLTRLPVTLRTRPAR
ncbi:cytochrome P450 [Virgisporangium aliadipatigenens]|uniref:Cytochrome P450 n=1 Tax=Virgisporangium aliadipatigenens TaxID=741659 RepID=A0A8J4DVB6_9ACTN|nr:cytochrome P450 [Virgisporangium aliadipatigenens]GIJ50998.1 cytochrome P450 [Virgisporangium aliadipatigenens]